MTTEPEAKDSAGGVKKPAPFSKEVTFTFEDDFLVTMGWDTDAEELKFRVEMPTDA